MYFLHLTIRSELEWGSQFEATSPGKAHRQFGPLIRLTIPQKGCGGISKRVHSKKSHANKAQHDREESLRGVERRSGHVDMPKKG